MKIIQEREKVKYYKIIYLESGIEKRKQVETVKHLFGELVLMLNYDKIDPDTIEIQSVI